MSDKCQNCDGCGKIANDEDGTPWTFWENLPFKSSLAMVMGLVQPVPCPACGGTGEQPQEPAAPEGSDHA